MTLKELIYIGQSKKSAYRINSHDKKSLFERECQSDETLCYSVAEVPSENLNIVENALVFAQKPRLNDTYKDKFEYGTTVSIMDERTV